MLNSFIIIYFSLLCITAINSFDVEPRVAYGTRALAKNYPSQVFLNRKGGGFICGGSIISNQWVLTAAHCSHEDYENIIIHMGLQKKYDENQKDEVVRTVAQVFKHPLNDPQTNAYDVALLVMNETVDFDVYQQLKPMCLDLCGLDLSNRECWLTGFGDNNNINFPYDLQQIRMKWYPDQVECAEIFNSTGTEKMTERQFCMVSYSKPLLSTDPSHGGGCKGDSGGPLNCYVHKTWYQPGIVFAGNDCLTQPTIFQNVSKYADFIVQTSNYELPRYCPPNPACQQYNRVRSYWMRP